MRRRHLGAYFSRVCINLILACVGDSAGIRKVGCACLRMHVHIYIYIYMHIYMNICIYICIYTFIYIYIYTDLNIYIYIYVAESARRGVLLLSTRISHLYANVVRSTRRLTESPSRTRMSSQDFDCGNHGAGT